MMPRPDGLTICKAIKSDPNLRDITVVMLTAKGQEHDRAAGLTAGADEYLTKPFSPLELLSLVDRVLQPEWGTET